MDPSDGDGEQARCFAPSSAGNLLSEYPGDDRASEANFECLSARTDEGGGLCKDAMDGCRSEENGQCLGDLMRTKESLNFKVNKADEASNSAGFDEEIDLPGENGTVEGSRNSDADSGKAPAEVFIGNGTVRSKNDEIAPLDGASDVVAEGVGVVNGWHEALDFSSEEHCTRHDEVAAPSGPSLGLGSWFLNDWRGLDRCVSAASKGFVIGAGIKGGLALFGILGRLKRRSSAGRMAATKTTSETISAAWKETLRYGLFLATFAGTFASVDEAIAALGGRTRTARWRAFLAGGVAGPSMLLTGLNTQHPSLAIYILMRAAVLASRCGIKSDKFGSLCKPLTWSYGDIFLMCLSSSQILSAYILKQDSLPSSYKSFLNKHGGKDPLILKGVKELVSSMPSTSLRAIEEYYKSAGVDIKLDPTMKIPCLIVHGKQSCAAHAISFIFRAYARSFPVYFPVYFIPALIVHRRGLLKEPYTILRKGLLGTARSSLFLSVYCTSAWIWTCVLFQATKRCDIPTLAIGTFPAGLALLIEKKSRRMEIALYCFARALESFFSTISESGFLPGARRMKRVDALLFSLSTAIIMHSYAQERDVFRSKYLNVLDWVFGVPHATDHSSNKMHGEIPMPQKTEHVS